MIPVILAGLAGCMLMGNPRRRAKRRRRNPHLGNKGDEFKKHASLRILQDTIEKNHGMRLSLAQVKEFLLASTKAAYHSALMKSFRVIEGKRRTNPISIDTLAMPVAGIFWRKHGYQSPGHAEDLAMMARRGTMAAKLWARVAQITKSWLYAGKKRSNPRR